jgi:hypothetical protein
MAIWNICGHFGYFMTFWYSSCSFGAFFPVLVSRTEKNLATLLNMIGFYKKLSLLRPERL